MTIKKNIAGFGESQGQRAIIDDYRKYVRDTLQLFDEEQAKFSDLPAFVMGQSMVVIIYKMYNCCCFMLLSLQWN